MSAAFLLRLILWPWFIAAAYAGHALLLQRVHPAGFPAIVLLLTATALMACLHLDTLRLAAEAVDLRRLVLLHVARFIGLAYLVAYHRGDLPYAFAMPAGLGDFAIAAFAFPVALAPLGAAARLRAISIWNIAGLFDLLFVIATATRLLLGAPESMRAFTELPLSLLPTFFIPLLLATHVVILIRLSRSAPAA